MSGKKALFGVLCLFVLGGAVWLALSREKAEAGYTKETTKDLVTFLNGDAAFDLKLKALDALRKRTDSGVAGDLEKLAKGADTKLGVFVTTALGKKGTSDAKKKLKALLESSTVNINVRIGALAAIAHHWKDESDLSYLEKQAKADSKLSSQLTTLKKKVYGQ